MEQCVLVVDDDEGIVESLRMLLEYGGYRVATAQDGDTLFDALKKVHPCLILLDYWLPGRNGGELTKELKSAEETKNIPVLVISASYNVKEVVAKAGADGFVPKPYDMRTLLREVGRCCSVPLPSTYQG